MDGKKNLNHVRLELLIVLLFLVQKNTRQITMATMMMIIIIKFMFFNIKNRMIQWNTPKPKTTTEIKSEKKVENPMIVWHAHHHHHRYYHHHQYGPYNYRSKNQKT